MTSTPPLKEWPFAESFARYVEAMKAAQAMPYGMVLVIYDETSPDGVKYEVVDASAAGAVREATS